MLKFYRTNDCQEPIDGHEDEGVDADEGSHVDQILDRLDQKDQTIFKI